MHNMPAVGLFIDIAQLIRNFGSAAPILKKRGKEGLWQAFALGLRWVPELTRRAVQDARDDGLTYKIG
jgi:hypothetical protein